MKIEAIRKLMGVLGWLALLAGTAMLMYIVGALFDGSIVLASRSGKTVVLFGRSPGVFMFALLIYVVVCICCLWSAKILIAGSRKNP